MRSECIHCTTIWCTDLSLDMQLRLCHISTCEVQSLILLQNDAESLAEAVRSHWGIENPLHWVFDVAFREDGSRVRKGHAPERLASLRHITLDPIRQEETAKLRVKNKRLEAGRGDNYLAKVVFGP